MFKKDDFYAHSKYFKYVFCVSFGSTLKLTLMKNLIFALFSFTLLMSCASDNQSKNNANDISSLENAYKSDPVLANANPLIAAYKESLGSGIDQQAKVNTQNSIAELYTKFNRPDQAKDALFGALRLKPDAGAKTAIYAQLAETAMKLKDKSIANIILKSLVSSTPSMAHLDSKITSKLTNAEMIEDQQDQMYDKDHRFIASEAKKYVDMCEAFAVLNPDAPDVAVVLHKAGETARTLSNHKKAIEIYDWILDDYPNHEKTAQALFLKAFTYDNNMKDPKTAKSLYELFLQKYPNDDFADDTKFLLENIGKSDEEIIKGFEKK